LLPDLDRYTSKPLEYGRMDAIASDASVRQPYGMFVGLPNAGQVDALTTGLPVSLSLVFRCEPGKEDIVSRTASAYEATSRRRAPPSAFGDLPRN